MGPRFHDFAIESMIGCLLSGLVRVTTIGQQPGIIAPIEKPSVGAGEAGQPTDVGWIGQERGPLVDQIALKP